jgi:hypothetical protein
MTGRHPLLDTTGQQMRWARRLKPQIAQYAQQSCPLLPLSMSDLATDTLALEQ